MDQNEFDQLINQDEHTKNHTSNIWNHEEKAKALSTKFNHVKTLIPNLSIN